MIRQTMLTIWLAVALVCPFAGMAQEMARQGDAEHLVPQGWESKRAVGDLDRDGIDDMVVVAQPNDERHLKVRDDGYVYNFNPHVLAIYRGKGGGQYELWRLYKDAIPMNASETVSVDVSVGVNQKGVISIGFETFASAGGWGNGDIEYKIRYQKGDFYIIGYDESSMARNTGEQEKISENYLTHKRCVTTSNVFDDKVPARTKWSSLPATPLRRLGDEPLNY